MEFKDLKVGDTVKIRAVKGSPYKRNYTSFIQETKIISVKKGKVQVEYRRYWISENEWNDGISNEAKMIKL